RRVNDSDRNAQSLLQVLAEVVSNRREPAHRFRAAFQPAAVIAADRHGRLWRVLGSLADPEEPELGVLRGCLYFSRGVAGVNGPFHVRLTAGDPDLSDIYVFERGLVHCQGIGPSRFLRRQVHSPISVLVRLRHPGFRSWSFLREGYADGFVRLSGTP